VPLIAGRNFTRDSRFNKEIILNEEAVKVYGFKSPEDAINKKLIFLKVLSFEWDSEIGPILFLNIKNQFEIYLLDLQIVYQYFHRTHSFR